MNRCAKIVSLTALKTRNTLPSPQKNGLFVQIQIINKILSDGLECKDVELITQ